MKHVLRIPELRIGVLAAMATLVVLYGCATTSDPFFASQDDGRRAMAGGGSQLRLVATSEEVGGYFDVVDHRWPPGAGTNMHVHEFDAFYYVLEGAITVDYEDYTRSGAAGSLFYHPRGVAHQVSDASGNGFRMLLLYAPGFGDGMDKLLDAMAQLEPGDPNFGGQTAEVLKNVGKTQPQ